MSLPYRNRKDVFSLKPLLAGLALLLLGAGVFAYYLIPRAAAVSVEQVPETPLTETKAETPDPDETPDQPGTDTDTSRLPDRTHLSNAAHRVVKTPGRKKPRPAPPAPPAIELTSPESGKTLLSSDPIKIQARVLNEKAVKVDFFYSKLTGSGASIYNTAAGIQTTNSPLVRIGGTNEKPYRLENARLEKGVYSIYGIVTGQDGIRQISSPTTIIIREYAPGADTNDEGWFPPIPRPEPDPCMIARVRSSSPNEIQTSDIEVQYVVEGDQVTFTASTYPRAKNLKYHWHTGEKDSRSIVVDTHDLGGQTLTAIVDVEDDKGCRVTASGKAYIVQSKDSIYDWFPSSSEETTSETTRSGDVSPPDRPLLEAPYRGCPATLEKLSLNTYLIDSHSLQDREGDSTLLDVWPDNLNFCLLNKKDPLDESEYLRLRLGRRIRGVYAKDLSFRHFTNGGRITVEGDDIIWDLTSVKNIPGDYSAVFETTDSCGTGSSVAKTVHITNYCTTCLKGEFESNLANESSPAALFVDLTGGPGLSNEKELHYNWSADSETKIEGNGTNVVTLTDWDHTIFRGKKITLDPKVEISGLSGRNDRLIFTADLPVMYPDGTRAKLKYDWTLSDPDGREIVSGNKTDTVEIDLRGLNVPDRAALSVKISGFNYLTFTAEPAGRNTRPPEDLKCRWSGVSPGRIVQGQGTNTLVVDTLDLPKGTPVTAFVQCEGMKTGCHNGLFIYGEAGHVIPPSSGRMTGPEPEDQARPAQTNIQNGETVQTGTSYQNVTGERSAGNSGHAAPGPTPQVTPQPGGKTGEREFIKIGWPTETEPVYINQAFSIFVSYNRTAEALQVTDTSGAVVAELKSSDMQRLIKDKFGPGREVLAQVRLQSAALYQSDTVTCSPNCQADYLSLASAEQKWTFNVTAHNPGEHKFNLEMWVKPKTDDPAISPERIWAKEDLKIAISPEAPTRIQIYASSAVLGLFGLIFFARGINFKLLIAGGDIVGGDKVGGHKVGGDMVGGDKIGGDKLDPGG
jgi:hypothetical protein